MHHRFIINDGQLVDLYDVANVDINMDTIAHSLSNQCRYNGHTDHFYSVAQHCCLAHDNATEIPPIAALLHDAAEAFTGDIVRPVKQCFSDLKQLEYDILLIILRHFDMPYLIELCEGEVMHNIDRRMLATEKRDLFKFNKHDWPGLENIEPFTEIIKPWTPTEAKKQWLKRLKFRH